MLSVDESRAIAATWRPRFSDPDAFVTSWSRYMEHYKHNRSPHSLESWLKGDAEQDEVRAAGLSPPVENARQDLPDLVDDCRSCRGKRWLRRNLTTGAQDFGKLLRCPACGGRPTQQRAPSVSEPITNRCAKCGRLEDENATDSCRNPRWHLPNWRTLATVDAPPGKRDYVAELAQRMRMA